MDFERISRENAVAIQAGICYSEGVLYWAFQCRADDSDLPG